MAILAVNAGSSSLKFSLHPLLGGRVRPSVLSGTIEGLEPGGQPEMVTATEQANGDQLLAAGGNGLAERGIGGVAARARRHHAVAPASKPCRRSSSAGLAASQAQASAASARAIRLASTSCARLGGGRNWPR